jgi:hypothetical protein
MVEKLIPALSLTYLLVVTDPYHGLVYEEINVYEVNYGKIRHPDDEDEDKEIARKHGYAYESGDERNSDTDNGFSFQY